VAAFSETPEVVPQLFEVAAQSQIVQKSIETPRPHLLQLLKHSLLSISSSLLKPLLNDHPTPQQYIKQGDRELRLVQSQALPHHAFVEELA
jgi:hypothetical protein